MEIKRAVGMALLAYLTSFLIGIFFFVLSGVDLETTQQIPTHLWFISITLTILVAGIFSWLYFKPKKTKAGVKEGLLLGILFVIVGFILDLIITLPFYFIGGEQFNILNYYIDPFFISSLVAVVLTATVIGWIIDLKR
jgi:hypothetical protein